MQELPGIKPHMFKNLIGQGHPEFSTKKQQDAQEFFLHLISILEVLLYIYYVHLYIFLSAVLLNYNFRCHDIKIKILLLSFN